jgi:hypothetical protein
MPQVTTVNSFTLLPRLPIPSVQHYLVFSAFALLSGLYYFTVVLHPFQNGTLSDGAETPSDILTTVDFPTIVEVVLKHRLLLYILLNSCCAVVTLVGKLLFSTLFDGLTPQEEGALRKSFRRFAQLKLTFLIFISHHNLIEDILIWMPWLAVHAVCLLLLEVSSSRMSNPYNVVSNKNVRHKLFITNSLTGISSILMTMFVYSIRSYLSLNYTLFLLADVCPIQKRQCSS